MFCDFVYCFHVNRFNSIIFALILIMLAIDIVILKWLFSKIALPFKRFYAWLKKCVAVLRACGNKNENMCVAVRSGVAMCVLDHCCMITVRQMD